MIEKIITDEEFVSTFLNFNSKARPAISSLLENALLNEPKLMVGDKWVIYLTILENYYFTTETVLMLLQSFHKKKSQTVKSLASIYSKTSINEGKNRRDTEKMLGIITNSNNERFLNYLGLKSIEKLFDEITDEKKKEVKSIWGNFENAIEQGYKELNNLRESLKNILNNRIANLDGLEIPFFKILNKLKHGYQIFPSQEENIIYVPIDVIESKKNKTTFDTLVIPYTQEYVKFFSTQTKYMSQSIDHLLMLYSFNL